MDVNHKSLHGKNKLYNQGGGTIVASFQEMDVIRMNELLKTKFGAIEVTAKLLGEPHPRFSLHTSESSPFSLPLSGGVFHHQTTSPAFVWRMAKGKNYMYFVLNSDEEFSIKYPIKQINAYRSANKLAPYMTSKTINNEQELLDVLDEILHNL